MQNNFARNLVLSSKMKQCQLYRDILGSNLRLQQVYMASGAPSVEKRGWCRVNLMLHVQRGIEVESFRFRPDRRSHVRQRSSSVSMPLVHRLQIGQAFRLQLGTQKELIYVVITFVNQIAPPMNARPNGWKES